MGACLPLSEQGRPQRGSQSSGKVEGQTKVNRVRERGSGPLAGEVSKMWADLAE